MKQEPVKHVTRPSYPTLDQVKKYPQTSTLTKVAAVTAVTATIAMAATACGDSVEHNYSFGEAFKGLLREVPKATTVELAGDTTTETTEEVLMGEMIIETDETCINGDMVVYTEPVDTGLILDGEARPYVEED
ncbi:MAG: hypothetical protein J6Y08_06240 [Clostridiales bacterium]|nr:hypothetical protein [Clostridiales bacterium]